MDRRAERAWMTGLIERICAECPRRLATSDDERRAAEIVRDELERLGLVTQVLPFRFARSLHQALALHFGLGALGTAVGGVAPPLALLLHSAAAVSAWYEGTHRGYLLRRLLALRPSQNVMGVLPAEGPVALRVVLLAHVDAPLTGIVFHPRLVGLLGHDRPPPLGLLARPIELATKAEALLAAIALVRTLLGPLAWPLRPVEIALGLPGLGVLLANLDILVRNRVSPGVNDDLSGVASLGVLAARLAQSKRPEVELAFVATGCEEAGWGGAKALAQAMEGVWDKERTVVLALDGLSNGELRHLSAEGDVTRLPVPTRLAALAREVAHSEERFGPLRALEAPVGGTDATAFLARGWQAMGLVAVDAQRGAPRHYHLPSDTLAELDLDQLELSIDFVERLVEALVAERLDPS